MKCLSLLLESTLTSHFGDTFVNMATACQRKRYLCVNLLPPVFAKVTVFLFVWTQRSHAWVSPTCVCVPLRNANACRRLHRFERYAHNGKSRGIDTETGKVSRRKKKNKYSQFSKADGLSQDPLDALISESEEKNRQLELETMMRHNKPLPKDAVQQNEKRIRNQIEFPDTKTIDPYDPTTYGYTELGSIIGAHGVKGLLKIASVTDFSERLCQPGVRHLKLQTRRSPRKVQLLDGRHRMGDEYLIKLEGIGDRDAANKLRGAVLYARQEERPENVGDDEYLVSDLVGLEVFLEEGYGEEDEENEVSNDPSPGTRRQFVGNVGGIVLAEEMCEIPGLGQDLLEVVLPRGQGGLASWRDEMVLIPLVPQIVPRVVLKDRAIYITPPSGLLDLTYVREEKVRIKGFLPPAEEK